MSQGLLRHVQENSKSLKKRIPPVRPGNTVRVHQKILESTKDGAKERIQIFEGLVIAVNSGSGTDTTFTVRKISGGIGVEKVFPLHSTNIAQIEILRNAKTRQSKLYFMRNRTGKSARLKEAKLLGYELPEEEEEEVADEEAIQEAVEAAKATEEEEQGASDPEPASANDEPSKTDEPQESSDTEDAAPEADAAPEDAEAEKKPEETTEPTEEEPAKAEAEANEETAKDEKSAPEETE